MKTRIPLVLITFALVCFALVQNTQAVSPPPDGGYPGGNTAEGQNALLSLTSGTYNTAVGFFSLRSNTTANFNTGVGAGTLLANTGDSNTAVGTGALLSHTIGFGNTAIGSLALFSHSSGNNNTAIGAGALFGNTTGSANIALGTNAGINVTTAHAVICIGADGNNVSDSCFIGNISGADATGGDAVFVTSDGKLGTINPSSSVRFKEEIKQMDKASEVILALKPVTFRYKKEFETAGIPQFGLLAEEVEKVNADLVKRGRDGKLQTVRYDAVNAMLLNEFLKEHRKVEEQQATIGRLETAVAKQNATIAQQQKAMEAVTARLNEQAAHIQKMSAQLDASKAAPQMVSSNR